MNFFRKDGPVPSEEYKREMTRLKQTMKLAARNKVSHLDWTDTIDSDEEFERELHTWAEDTYAELEKEAERLKKTLPDQDRNPK